MNKRSAKDGPRVESGSRDARKTAAVILEVLGGARTTQQGAEAIGVTVPRYFQIERRALEGLILGCTPQPKGRKNKGPEDRIAKLEREIKQLERDNARYQALARVAQRTAGLLPPKDEGKKKRKRPVRAMKVVQSLRKEEVPVEA